MVKKLSFISTPNLYSISTLNDTDQERLVAQLSAGITPSDDNRLREISKKPMSLQNLDINYDKDPFDIFS